MELKEHVLALLLLNTAYLERKAEAISQKVQADMNAASANGDFVALGDALIGTVREFLPYGEKTHEPLKAFIGHVFAECPGARKAFAERLSKEHPELVDVLKV